MTIFPQCFIICFIMENFAKAEDPALRAAMDKGFDLALKVCTALLLLAALAMTFTVSDYYIFNRFGEFKTSFILSQWVKKAGLLLFPLAVFYKKRSCADVAKYLLPIFIVISCFTYGNYFDVTMVSESNTPAQALFAHINEFMPKTLHKCLFFFSNGMQLVLCVALFVRDGYVIKARSFLFVPVALLAVMPLNVFENFFDINQIPADSFLRFGNFTVWHFGAIVLVAAFTIGSYYFLKRKDASTRQEYLAALAIVLLIQYHSKDSMLLGDGYNVYKTVFSVIPLFICNLGVYVAALSVFTRKRVLYSLAFFVHAAGALTVFFYFGKPEMSNYGIFCSYTILYFVTTHCLLFALCVLPSALGQYKFRPRDAIVSLIYYFLVIVVASVASGLLTSASMSFTYNGYTLTEEEWLMPNFAFTQINPLPVALPMVPLTVWKYDFNALYLLILYLAYVAIFYLFNGAYYLFLYLRKKIAAGKSVKELPAAQGTASEIAASEDEPNNSSEE